MTKPKPKREPWHPAEWDVADAGAIQALARGDASESAQKRALDWIITRAAMTYDASFDPSSERVSSYIEGRRSVGNQIVKLMKLNLQTFSKDGREKND